MKCPNCGQEMTLDDFGDGRIQLVCNRCDYCLPDLYFSIEIDYDESIKKTLITEYKIICDKIVLATLPYGKLLKNLQDRTNSLGDNISIMQKHNNLWDSFNGDEGYRNDILKKLLLIDASKKLKETN